MARLTAGSTDDQWRFESLRGQDHSLLDVVRTGTSALALIQWLRAPFHCGQSGRRLKLPTEVQAVPRSTTRGVDIRPPYSSGM
jgi:hypothetical protein